MIVCGLINLCKIAKCVIDIDFGVTAIRVTVARDDVSIIENIFDGFNGAYKFIRDIEQMFIGAIRSVISSGG